MFLRCDPRVSAPESKRFAGRNVLYGEARLEVLCVVICPDLASISDQKIDQCSRGGENEGNQIEIAVQSQFGIVWGHDMSRCHEMSGIS